ncbi:hypothetical protein THII_1665 [Thioploca ingrica]|uniref:Uncharacterized protein n=1 Tax=Thioploca ingrica TaxID=40754 RepID=A0A090AK20_9GAMM|nr:hypothetical protein THII_1665 [Thioploca ingrica]
MVVLRRENPRLTQPTWLWWGTERLAQEQPRANRWAEQLKALGVEPQ